MQLQTIPVTTQQPVRKNRWIQQGIILLCWLSPFIELGIFFPMGVLLVFSNRHRIRAAAFESLVLQLFLILLFTPLEMLTFYNEAWRSKIFSLSIDYFWTIKRVLYLFIAPLVLLSEYLYWRKKKVNSPFMEFSNPSNRMARFSNLAFIFLLSIFMTEWKFFYWFSETLDGIAGSEGGGEQSFSLLVILQGLFSGDSFKDVILRSFSDLLYGFFLKNLIGLNLLKTNIVDFCIIFFMNLYFIRGKSVVRFLRRPFASLFVHRKYAGPTYDFKSFRFAHKYSYTKVRELLLPGWGHIYLNRYWIGFPLLFCFLLGLLFLVISICYMIGPGFGANFMNSLGLKSGISEKAFIGTVTHPVAPFLLAGFLLFIYFLSHYHIENSMRQDWEGEHERGLKPGFFRNFPISMLAHLILAAVILIVPLTIKRQQSKKTKKMMSNYKPEKMEYYFIDPEIPDKVEGLNGGVVSGIETIQKNKGEVITDEKEKDVGKVKGNVKRIKGKKLPKTYSNYISARMRGPEAFMDYWKRAPYPYSCVVAYTITNDGEVTDVQIVQGSNYPDQDELTIELIENMSPLMPPPGVNGDIRVTELFWNGTIDPNKMPTELQKDLVLQFDGRVMEEF